MKCMTCQVDIPPTFKDAIQNNKCPSCGQAIYTDEMKSLITEIREALEKMPNDPEGLAGWIVSNYNLTKVGDASPATFYGPKKNKKGPRPVARFPDNTEEYGDEENDYEDDEDSEESDERAKIFAKRAGVSKPKKNLKDVVKAIRNGESEQLLVSNMDDIPDDPGFSSDFIGQDHDPDEIAAMMASGGMSSSGAQAVKAEKLKVLKSRQNFASGSGSFRR